MNLKTRKFRRVLAFALSMATLFTALPAFSASANENPQPYPYTFFAESNENGAISTTAYNFCMNGNLATNGTFSIINAQYPNINGTRTENAEEDMIYIFDKIDTTYFSGTVAEQADDYVITDTNININTPTEVLGITDLTGNVNLNTALKSMDDILVDGDVKNANNSVVFSKYGDIIINSSNVNLNGLVYAPFGNVEITTQNLNLNCIVIAQNIVLNCPNVNANYSHNTANFVGTVSELLNFPVDEWQYMSDENENGLPDFIEDMDNWAKMLDSDGDNLPDCIENYLGSNPNMEDSDLDGLDDFYECFYLGTDPTKKDTDDNLIFDNMEDFDEDNLNNLSEKTNNTNPFDEDTDGDGLLDGDEVLIYGTNPLMPDSDLDGMNDYTEVHSGLDPNAEDSDGDGVLDSQETVKQTVNLHLTEDTEVIPTVKLTGVGDFNGKMTAKDVSKNTAISSLPYIVGEPFDFVHGEELDNIGGELSFKVSSDILAQHSIDNLAIAYFDYSNGAVTLMDTQRNGDTLTANVSHFSTYTVVLYDAFSINTQNYYPEGYYEPFKETETELQNRLETEKEEDIQEFLYSKNFEYGAPIYVNAYNNSIYAYFVTNKNDDSWYSYLDFCKTNGGHLATITSYGERTFLEKFQQQISGANFWLGGSQILGSGDWKWCNDEPWNDNISNWAEHAPDNSSQSTYLILFNDGKWEDYVNIEAGRFGFVCEWDNVIAYSEPYVFEHTPIPYYNSISLSGGIEVNIGENFIYDSSLGSMDLPGDNTFFTKNNQPIYTLDYIFSLDPDKDGKTTGAELQGKVPGTENGYYYSSNPNNPDSDGDGLNDGIDPAPLYYNEIQPSNMVSISDTTKEEADFDGNFNMSDLTTVLQGEAGDIVGEISLISSNHELGHTYIAYKSYINDVLDLSKFLVGYDRISLEGNIIYKEIEPTDKYYIKAGEIIAFGNFMEGTKDIAMFKTGGLYFNREIFNYLDLYINGNDEHYTYQPNSYITHQINRNQLNQIIDAIDKKGEKYNLLTYNCTDVAVNGWLTVFDDEFKDNLEELKVTTTLIPPYDTSILFERRIIFSPAIIKLVIESCNDSKQNFDLGGLI